MSLHDQFQSLGIPFPEDLAGELEKWVTRLGAAPCRSTLSLVGLSTVVFYLSERGRNPKVRDIYDALVYCTTCMSVGYADIFARTPVGKLIGSALMTVGPSLAARATDGRANPDPVGQEILATLKQILARLEEAPRTA